MANEFLTLLDIAKRNIGDFAAPLIDEAVMLMPEWGWQAKTIPGTAYDVGVRVSLPSVGFRHTNEGTEVKKGERDKRHVECFVLDASWDFDLALADAHEGGMEAAAAEEAADHIAGAAQKLCQQFYYGTALDAKGFPGLEELVDSTMVVDATGTGETGSSVWAVKLGPTGIMPVMGKNGNWRTADPDRALVVQKVGTVEKRFWRMAQPLIGWFGLQAKSRYAFAKVKNITAAAGKILTDTMMDSLMEKMFTKGIIPDAIMMHPRSLAQLKSGRTATNESGQPAAWPDGYRISVSINGEYVQRTIPFLASTAIKITETCA